MPAVVTVSAGNVMKKHHAVAHPIVGDAFPGGNHSAGGFMAKYARRRMGAGCDLFQVSPADTAGVNLDQ
jgi:hypothetical protein